MDWEMNDEKFMIIAYYTTNLLIVVMGIGSFIIDRSVSLFYISMFLLVVPIIIILSYKLVVKVYDKVEKILTKE